MEVEHKAWSATLHWQVSGVFGEDILHGVGSAKCFQHALTLRRLDS